MHGACACLGAVDFGIRPPALLLFLPHWLRHQPASHRLFIGLLKKPAKGPRFVHFMLADYVVVVPAAKVLPIVEPRVQLRRRLNVQTELCRGNVPRLLFVGHEGDASHPIGHGNARQFTASQPSGRLSGYVREIIQVARLSRESATPPRALQALHHLRALRGRK